MRCSCFRRSPSMGFCDTGKRAAERSKGGGRRRFGRVVPRTGTRGRDSLCRWRNVVVGGAVAEKQGFSTPCGVVESCEREVEGRGSKRGISGWCDVEGVQERMLTSGSVSGSSDRRVVIGKLTRALERVGDEETLW